MYYVIVDLMRSTQNLGYNGKVHEMVYCLGGWVGVGVGVGVGVHGPLTATLNSGISRLSEEYRKTYSEHHCFMT